MPSNRREGESDRRVTRSKRKGKKRSHGDKEWRRRHPSSDSSSGAESKGNSIRERSRSRCSSSGSQSSSLDTKWQKRDKKMRNKKNKKEKKKDEPKHPIQFIGPLVPSVADSSGSVSNPSQRILKPMTKEEWEKQQSVIRHVLDPETGRTRLVKGDGEILEEIITRDRHREINKQATHSDGVHFLSKMGLFK